MINQEALQYLVELNTTEVIEVNGQKYSTNRINLVHQPTPSPLTVRNLSGLVEYLQNDFDNQPPVMIHIESPTSVKVLSTFNQDFARNTLIEAKALLPDIPFERFQGTEEFIIQLQSCFVPTSDRDAMMQIVGNIQESAVSTVGDDGVSQSVVAKQGVTTVAAVKLPNPVKLKPFRTFIEIAQPECSFVFRMQSGPRAALFEADGGAWKLQAIADIKTYLANALEKEIKDQKVVIIA